MPSHKNIKGVFGSYSYSCQICQKPIKTTDKCFFQEFYSPICSQRCLFKLLYRILKTYNKKHITYLKKYYSIENNASNSYQSDIFLITKKIINTPLPTTNHLSHLSKPLSDNTDEKPLIYHLSYQSIPFRVLIDK